MAIGKVGTLLKMNQDITKQKHFQQLQGQYGGLFKQLDGLQGDARAKAYSSLNQQQRTAIKDMENFRTKDGAPPSQGNMTLAFGTSAPQRARGSEIKGERPQGNRITPKVDMAALDEILAQPTNPYSKELIRTRSINKSGSFSGQMPRGNDRTPLQEAAPGTTSGDASGGDGGGFWSKVWDKTKVSDAGWHKPDMGIDTSTGVAQNLRHNYQGAKDWLSSGTRMDTVKKVGMVAGAYAGANVGLRELNGGGATYNNRGERDIAGIPFI